MSCHPLIQPMEWHLHFFTVHVVAKLFTKDTEMNKKPKNNVKAPCLPSEGLQPRDNP